MNIDDDVVQDFGAEWSKFDQAALSEGEWQALFSAYFAVFPWDLLPVGAVGMDIGCGSGRWARGVAPKVGRLLVVDPAARALEVARRNLAPFGNVSFFHAGVDSLPVPNASLDFAYSLGVLHHVPDTSEAIRSIAEKLKPGAPFLIYLYYALDNRPGWFRRVWQASNVVRRVISSLPRHLKHPVCELIAALIYWPLARLARLVERLGGTPHHMPLSAYRHLSFYTMRTDALDRFGTRLEQRFTRDQIQAMLERSGFRDIRFHDGEPYWCAVGVRQS